MFGKNMIDANDVKLLKEAASRLVDAVRRDNEEATWRRHQQMISKNKRYHEDQQGQEHQYKRQKH